MKILGQKQTKRDPIYDLKTKELIDSGENMVLTLGQFDDIKICKYFLENLKQNVKKYQWKFWIE